MQVSPIDYQYLLLHVSSYSQTDSYPLVRCISILPKVNKLLLTNCSYLPIEFQRRGLPHAHILIFFKDKDKYPEPSQIDKIISAEIPNKDEDPEEIGRAHV